MSQSKQNRRRAGKGKVRKGRKEGVKGRKDKEKRRKRQGKGKVKAYSKVVPKNSGDTLSTSQTLLHRLSIMKLSQTHQTGLAILHLPTAALLNTDHT